MNVKKLVTTALCIALCIVLPVAFHAIPNAGSVLSPMHIPVLLCGLTCGWGWGLLCGILGPFFSSVIMQMPPLAYLPGMMLELAVYGLVTGIMMQFVHTKKFYADLYLSLFTAMLLGRVASGAANALIFSAGSYSFGIWASAYFVQGIPGIIMHLVLIPSIAAALEKAKLIPKRD